VFFALASPSPAQIEPESFTILKIALNTNPPNPANAVTLLLKYKDPSDRTKLQVTWLESLAKKAAGKVADKRKRMEAMFDAFDDCFAADEKAIQRARTFIKLRDELLARQTREEEIERSAAAFVDWLRVMPKADRNVLKEFGRLAKYRIPKVVE
jgi:hypothetical protein